LVYKNWGGGLKKVKKTHKKTKKAKKTNKKLKKRKKSEKMTRFMV